MKMKKTRRTFMTKTKKYIFLVFISIVQSQFISAQVKLPAVVSSHMVLQRNTTVVLWGWADSNEPISIKTSWLKKRLKTKADALGNWRIEVLTTNSKIPQSIIIKGKSSEIVLEDILFGEVWLCSGQSNMYQPIKGYGNGQVTINSMLAKAKAGNSKVRLFTAARKNSKTPLDDLIEYTPWQQATANNVNDFSAVAWFFAEQLQDILDVPVGIIHSSWGGTPIEAWMSKEAISKYEVLNLGNKRLKETAKRYPTILYNAMIHPLIPYTIKGALWYQGEANRKKPEQYKVYLPAMVADWRTRWGLGDFPFYFVQIAPYAYEIKDGKTSNSALMRVAQEECVELIPNSGIAITTDLGAKTRIHPPFKKEVADRLLYNALQQSYGIKGVDGKSPIYDSMEIKKNEIHVTFKNAETGLFAFDGLQNFEIAGVDKVFYPAKARIENNNTVIVKSESVQKPIAVRYAWDNWVKGTLYDKNLLPASSFRTDSWEKSSRYTEGIIETKDKVLDTEN